MTFAQKTAGSVLLLTLVLQVSAAVAAQQFESSTEQVQLVELYTSEGCSSCPPADKRLAKFKSDKGLWVERVPVAFHVDYWDYIGWEDPYASAANSARQRAHSASGNLKNVYTPGFVVDGAEWRGFFRGGRWPSLSKREPGALSLAYEAGQVRISFDPIQQPQTDLRLQIAWLGAGLETDVSDGENMGRKLKHDFVVLKRKQWALSEKTNYEHSGVFGGDNLPPADQYALVAWIEDPRGRPVQAVGGWAIP